MQEIKLTEAAARALAESLSGILGAKVPGLAIRYVSIRAGDPSGSPEGCEEAELTPVYRAMTVDENSPTAASSIVLEAHGLSPQTVEQSFVPNKPEPKPQPKPSPKVEFDGKGYLLEQ